MDTTTTTTDRVVVGVDGSEASIAAVRWAVRYAELTGAQVEAVTSWAFPQAYGFGLGTGFETTAVDWPAIAQKIQETALSQALPKGSGSIIHTVIQNHPAAALIEAAEAAELLVVGSRGHGGFAGMLLGSVSDHVVAHASCPVVVVRHLEDPPTHDKMDETPDGTETADATSQETRQ